MNPVSPSPTGHSFRVGRVLLDRARLYVQRPRAIAAVPCGDGELIAAAVEAFPAAGLVGVDPDPRRLAHAGRWLPQARFLCAAPDDVPLPSASCDLVVSIADRWPARSAFSYLRELRRLLALGGMLGLVGDGIRLHPSDLAGAGLFARETYVMTPSATNPAVTVMLLQ